MNQTKQYQSKALIFSALLFLFFMTTNSVHAKNENNSTVRIATFNVSMEALNYVDKGTSVDGSEVVQALANQHQQIRNIAEIIQRTSPDIILLNEFDYTADTKNGIEKFVSDYLNKPQSGQTPVDYPYFFISPSNTGIPFPEKFALSENDPKSYGFGHFPGHFAMALLSKYPIDTKDIRTFQKFLWKDMPGALKPIMPNSNASYYSGAAWNNLRLSSKSHWDIPINVNGKTIHVLASHPTPPVFDGEEDRNGKRNHDEIRLWADYLSGTNANYIYDDNNKRGGLNENQRFVLLGDLNATTVEGNAITRGIRSLIEHPKVVDPLPKSLGGERHSPENKHAATHTANWRMRVDYVLPSKYGLKVIDSGVFWPTEDQESYRLIKDRAASSDHRLVWVDVLLK